MKGPKVTTNKMLIKGPRRGIKRVNIEDSYTHSRPARKNATNRNLLQQKLYCFHLQEQEREWRNPVPFKENYPPPRTCHSLIGCSPSAELSSRGRQSTWSGELPWHMRRLFVYYLEHRMSAPSCNGECEGGSPQIWRYIFLFLDKRTFNMARTR